MASPNESDTVPRTMDRVRLITTGGTIEKTYDEETGELSNRRSIVRRMLHELRLDDLEVEIVELMSKDSLFLDDADRERIVAAVREAIEKAPCPTGVVILHGTDTLTRTGDRILEALPRPPVPVVLTGAMRPFEMKRSDALQNLTEALFAARALAPGVYCVAHGRALPFPGVVKDREHGTFVVGG
jgi:L-asparaginase